MTRAKKYDQGGEYTLNNFKTFSTQQGIRHQIVLP